MSYGVYRHPYRRPPARRLAPLSLPAADVVVIPDAAVLAVATFAPPLVSTLIDDFNDNSRDTAKWTLGSIAFENASVGVDEVNQQLEITPLALTGTAAIYGYKSVNTYDFTAREASVRIAADIGTGTEAWLVVAMDVDNYFRIWVAGGNIQTRSRVGGGNSNL